MKKKNQDVNPLVYISVPFQHNVEFNIPPDAGWLKNNYVPPLISG